MEPWQERVVEEMAQLRDRLCNLTAFMGTSTFDGLPPEERDRLWHQHNHMGGYLMMLCERKASWE
jgi:hypothetical protein